MATWYFSPGRSLHVGLALALLSSSASSSPAAPVTGEKAFYPYSKIVPSHSLGGTSAYGNLNPTVEKDTEGNIAAIKLTPPGGTKSASLLWWYADHIKTKLTEWPNGKDSRIQLVVHSDAPAEISITASLETKSGWAEGADPVSVHLHPARETAVYIPMPPAQEGPVGKIRLAFNSAKPLPGLEIKEMSAGYLAEATLTIPDTTVWLTTNPVKVSGRAPGKSGTTVLIQALDETKKKVGEWKAVTSMGGDFTFEVDRRTLPESSRLVLAPSVSGSAPAPITYPFFNFPVLDPAKRMTRVTKSGRNLMLGEKPYAFVGVNYTAFGLGLSRKADYELVARNFREMKSWGISTIRLTLALAMIQPAPGVFPDHPKYKETLRHAGLDPKFFELLQYAIALGRHYDIRVVFDWHESMVDAYRYFLGGKPEDKDSGKPGTPIAWLAMPKEEYPKEDHPLFIQMDNPKHLAALFDTTSWLAKAFQGEPVVLGYEVPYNEPHERKISNDSAWRWLTSQSALRVKQADPGALTFGMPSGWGHENVFISSTWLIPDLLDGMTPHFYVGNGPVPIRPDSKQRRYPYLARDVEMSLSTGLNALALPYSACSYPVYNGEGGGHGAESFLPDLPLNDATRIMIEAQICQAYATGMAGYFEWTMWNNEFWKKTTLPNKELFQRYSPVFAAGPVNFKSSQILFVQNPAAESNANGHNFACVPIARMALDLHLQPVHYMTDDQLIYSGQTMYSRGFEQVDASGEGLGGYKVIVLDSRNIDSRAKSIVEKSGIPFIEFTQERPIDPEACAQFFEKHGVPVDRKTSKEFQLIKGPSHFVVYRRAEGHARSVYPILEMDGEFQLVREDGSIGFSGNTAKLRDEGLPVRLEKWTSEILTIRRK